MFWPEGKIPRPLFLYASQPETHSHFIAYIIRNECRRYPSNQKIFIAYYVCNKFVYF